MREEEKPTRANQLKRALYKIYLRDDTANLAETIRQACELWNCSKEEVWEVLNELLKMKQIKIEKGLNWIWLEEGFANRLSERQETLFESPYF